MRKRDALLLGVVVVSVAAAPALAATPKLTGTVGPGSTITMKKPTKPGKATLVVSDRASDHNFHLKGPGVNVKTSVRAKGSKTFTVTFTKGKYTYLCDPHPTTMKGSFTIG